MSDDQILDANFIDELETVLNQEEIFNPSSSAGGGDTMTANAGELSQEGGNNNSNIVNHDGVSLVKHENNIETLPSTTNSSAKTVLIAWFIAQADIPSTKSSLYAELLINSGTLSIKKMVKNIKKNPNFLVTLGIPEVDATVIISALIRENYMEPIENSNLNMENEQIESTISVDIKDLEKSVQEIRKILQQVIDAHDSFVVEKLAKEACNDIVSVASNSFEGQLALGKAGICEDLVVVITIYTSSSPRVLQRALCALCALCRRKMDDRTTQCLENIILLGEVRACQVTIAALRKYEDNLVIIKWAAGAIRNLCSIDQNRTKFGTSGACQSLMQIARRYESNEDVLRWVFRALGNVANGNNENRSSLIHHGFCEFVITSMQSHSRNALVLADCCWSIRSVALGDQVCRSQLIDLKACDIITQNLKTHYTVDFLISEACLALVALSTDAESAIIRLAQEGACFAFTLPLLGTNDPSQFLSTTQTSCCGEVAAIECLSAIQSFAINDRVRNQFFEAGAGEACGCALRCHPNSPEVAVSACKAIYKLSTSQSSSKKLRRARVCEALASLLSNQLAADHADVAEWSGLCVSVLAIDKSNRELLAKSNVCESVVKLLKIHESAPDVAYRMCGAVHFLSIDESIRSQLGTLGACEIVTSVLRTHTVIASGAPRGATIHEGAVQASCRALGSLACESPENNLKFADCGVSDVLSLAFKTFRSSPAMIEFCCRAISRVCTCDSTLMSFSSLSGCNHVVNAIVDYVETDTVVKHALLAAYILTNPIQSHGEVSMLIRENIRKFRDAPGFLVSVVRAFELHSANQILIAQTGSSVFRHLFSEISVNLSKSDSPNNTVALDACRVMISCLKPQIKSSAVQLEVMSAIEVVSCYGVPAITLGQMNYLTLLIATLVQHSQNSEVTKSVLQTFIRLVDEIENIHFVCNSQGCAAVLEALNIQSNNFEILRIGFQLIEKLAQNDNYRNILNSASVCDVLTGLLQKYCPPREDTVLLALFSTITTLCLLDRNTAAFSNLPAFHDSLCLLLSSVSLDIAVLEGACRIVVILLAFARFPDEISPVNVDDEEENPQMISLGRAKSITRRPSLAESNLIQSKNSLIDEPSVGASSSPKRRYHSTYLNEVVNHTFSQFSQNPVYSGNEPPKFITHQTYPNISKYVERKIEVIYGNLLLNHPDNEVIVWLIFEGLSLITLEEEGVQSITAVSDANISELVCRIFGTFITKSERLECAGCKILTNVSISQNGEYTELLGHLGACSLIPIFLNHYYTLSPEAVRLGCSSLAYMCKQNSNNRISLAANGACEILFSCLQKFIFNPTIVTQVIHAVKCLCSQNKINTTSFSSLGTLDFLIENLLGTELLVGDNALIGSTLWCIGHIPPAVLSHLWSKRVIEFVMNAFRDHFTDLSSSALNENGYIIMSACEAVYTLCSYVEYRNAIFGQYDICEIIVSVIRFYEHDENVLHSALMALANLLDHIPENQQKVQEIIILKTMQMRCQSLVVIRGGLAALLGIVHGNPNYPEKLSSTAAIKIILKGIYLHYHDSIIAKRGSSLIAILSSYNRTYQRVLGTEGACGILFDIIHQHESNVHVIREATWALCCLSYQHDGNKIKIIGTNGIEELSKYMKYYSSNESILVWVCGTMANITTVQSSSYIPRYIACNTCAMLIDLLQIYGLGGDEGNNNILSSLCWCIGNLAQNSQLCEIFGTSGACEQFILILLKHLENHAIVDSTLMTIKNLSKVTMNKKKFEESGLVELLDQVNQRYQGTPPSTGTVSGQEETLIMIKKIRNIYHPTKLFHFGGGSSGGNDGGRVSEREEEASGGESVNEEEDRVEGPGGR